MQTVLLINIISSFLLCGLIWTVQLVHYPSFHRIDRALFIEHMKDHKFRISLLVVPLMLFEFGTSAGLAFYSDTYSMIHQVGFLVVIFIWLVTFFVQVPLHNKLSIGYQEESISRLVQTNMIRTLLWTIKAGLGVYLLLNFI